MGSRTARRARGHRRGGRPRLLILTPDFPPAPGGIQVVAHRLASGLEAFDATVIAPDAPEAARFDVDSGVRTQRVRGGGALRGGRNALLNAAALARGLSLRPDLTLSLHIVTSPAAAGIRSAAGAPTVQYFHAEEVGAKPRLAAFAAEHADASIAVSEYTAGLVAATGAMPRALHVIGNGTDVPENASPLVEERPTFVTIARIEERYKGHDTIVRALPLVLAKVPDAQWVVIGDGSLRPGLEALAASYGVAQAIRFLGVVCDEQRNVWLRRARLLAMPSRLPAGGFAGEGFGIVYLEAGAYGKPVVAGNVGGALDSVRDGETGLLVDPTDPLLVAEAITRLLLDPELAGRLGEAGRRHALAHTWSHVVARVQDVMLAQLAGR
ncbi:MAG: glycosyltransferase family 4 protein [Solirubrobacterales bacterium]